MNPELYNIYYIQTNAMCMVLLAFVLVAYIKEIHGASEGGYCKAEIIGIMLYCLSDMVAAICKSETFPGARLILWLANTIYIAFPALLVVLWGHYIVAHMEKFGFRKGRFDRIFRILVMIGFMITLTSPVTHFAFYLDENNIYHRNPGVFLIPVLSFAYMIYDTVKLIVLSRKIDSLEGRREAKTLSVFFIPCALLSLLQMFVYGCTTAQVGFTLGFMIVYLVGQQNKISKDALTGLNNRREFEKQFDNMVKSAEKILVSMIDVDFFKNINDTYGHVEGDSAIKNIALVLSKACAKCKSEGDFFLSRYGGDEFVILSKEFNEGVDRMLLEVIQSELTAVNEKKDKPYTLQLSIGTAQGTVSCKKDAVDIMKKADSEMYKVKKAKHLRKSSGFQVR
ncbi:MAG: GGDEF domain-containing protein [Lachnospiraceae bacterium]|nr:GGDEF domain-containing protein [Lachnospiraceae bacterium]